MTSVKDQSTAAKLLMIATGEARHQIGIKNMRPKEVADLLREHLYPSDIRELDGFKELGQELSRKTSVLAELDIQTRPDTIVQWEGALPSFLLTIHSQVTGITVFNQQLTYKKYEGGEETTDWKHFHENWKGRGYIKSGREEALLLRRLPERLETGKGMVFPTEDDMLIEVSYEFIKVPDKKLWEIKTVHARSVPLSSFRKRFDGNPSRMIMQVLRQITSLCNRTAGELKHKASRLEKKAAALDRLLDSVH